MSDLITVDPARLSTVAMATLHVERGTSERLQSSGRLCTVPYLAHGLKHLSPAAVKPCAYQCTATVPWPGSLPDYCCTYVRVRAYARAAPDSFPNLREILVDSFHIPHIQFHVLHIPFQSMVQSTPQTGVRVQAPGCPDCALTLLCNAHSYGFLKLI